MPPRGFLELERLSTLRLLWRLLTYRDELGPPLDSEVEGAAPRDRRFRALTCPGIYYIEFTVRPRDTRIAIPPDAPSFLSSLRAPHLLSPPFPVPAVSPPSPVPASFSRHLPPSTSCTHPRSFLFPSSSTYHLRHTPQRLNPTEGAVGECLVLLDVGVAFCIRYSPVAAVPGYSERQRQRCERHGRWAAVVRASAAAISTANLPASQTRG